MRSTGIHVKRCLEEGSFTPKTQNKTHNIFWDNTVKLLVALLNEKTLDEILKYLEKSITNLAKETLENLEIEGGSQEVKSFLENQFELRLENLLVAKKSSIHHLESRMKNKIIQKKQKIFEQISIQYKI